IILIINRIDDFILQRFLIVDQPSDWIKNSIMCDPIGSILSGSEIYYDHHHNIIESSFNGLEQILILPFRVIDHQNDT
ncbi:hypothetical protein, partial [Escherichia coli]|uniref:hypothetical protein n=1 Tax=Escherichia coli TaxID=562 RepID=UPI0025755D49